VRRIIVVRKIIKIDEGKCNGCGLCANACQEGAIGMVKGKAKLLREDYCDGLGNCLPACPTGAITFEEREAKAFNEKGVEKQQQKEPQTSGCPGSMARTIQHTETKDTNAATRQTSQLRQWPVQIKLVSVNAAYFNNAKLLVSADCAAYAYGNFHADFIKDSVTLIGCPKLDDIDYTEKLTEIIKNNNIKSITVVRMEVPCCGGIEQAVKNALQNSGKMLPWQVVTVSVTGEIVG
jgi:ferredoxin